MTKAHDALDKALDLIGTQTDLAEKLRAINPKIQQAHISGWKRSKKGVPSQYCGAIEKLTGGQVTKRQLRPDLF